MKTKAKESESKKNQLTKRVLENERLINELRVKKNEIYDTTKDFTLSHTRTDEAIAKMRGIDSEVKKLTNKIRRDRASLSEL